jgi:alpha-beta hydrolase superfamily lysophospholipase
MGTANLNPWTEAKVNSKNPDRGPLLIIEGEKDHTVPWAIANAAYKRQRRNPGVTEIVKIPNRGHALTIDQGWQEVAQIALDFVKRFLPAKPSRPTLKKPLHLRTVATATHTHIREDVVSRRTL